jgi:hypothetical protein
MSEKPNSVHLALTGRIVFEQDISVAQGAHVIASVQAPSETAGAFAGPERPISSSIPATSPEEGAFEQSGPRAATPEKPLVESPRVALDTSGARTAPEKVTALAVYLTEVEEYETFRSKDLRRLFERARERIPTHFAREFDTAVRSGWIHEGTTKGTYFVADALKGLLTEGWAAHRQKRTRRPAGPGATPRRPRSSSTGTPEAFADLDLDHVPTDIEGVIPYHQIRLKRDKLLWAIKMAKDMGVPALKRSDVPWLTDRLGEAILSRDITAHYKGLHRDGLVNQSLEDRAMRITEAGEEYLRSL